MEKFEKIIYYFYKLKKFKNKKLYHFFLENLKQERSTIWIINY